MDKLPAALSAGARSRKPFDWEDREVLVAKTLEDRMRRRQDELEDAMGSRDVLVPELPDQNAPAQNACGTGDWWFVIVTQALRVDRAEHWLSADEVARVFTVAGSDCFMQTRN